MATLTREQLTSGRALKHETVPVPGLDGEANVYEMAPAQRTEFTRWALSLKPEGVELADWEPHGIDTLTIADYREQVLVRTLRDDDGKLLFTADDVPLLGSMFSEDALTLLCGVAVDLSGLTDKAIEKRADDPNSPAA